MHALVLARIYKRTHTSAGKGYRVYSHAELLSGVSGDLNDRLRVLDKGYTMLLEVLYPPPLTSHLIS
jgi:hypothetical protein